MAKTSLEEERVEVDDELNFMWHRPSMEEVRRQSSDPETVRIFLNGCFDLMHVGHFNALRQAKSVFYQKKYKHVTLVAGIHSDAAITRQKGQPLMSDEERIAVLRATKWVDELATDLPYVSMSTKMADKLLVDFICHGDDLPIVKGGGGMYSDAIDSGRFQLLKRTEGVSTTQILERLLRQTPGSTGAGAPPLEALGSALATTQRLSQFAAPPDPWRPRKALADAARVVYIDGTFDLLHTGHVKVLEAAAGLGDYVLVGLHADETVDRWRGRRPVLTLLERAMAVLSVRQVDDVVLGAPWEVTRELLTTMNVAVVAAGKKPVSLESTGSTVGMAGSRPYSAARSGRHDLARAMGIFSELESNCDVTFSSLQERFIAMREQFSERNSKLLQKELSYIESKCFVPEA